MSPFAFDTLSASKQLREAGMSEGVAEAVVSVFQHAATMPDISHLATKADLDALALATKADLEALSVTTRHDIEALSMAIRRDIDALRSSMDALASNVDALRSEAVWKSDIADMATKSDIADMATKSDIADMATRSDIAAVRLEIANLRADLQATIRQQGWLIMGGVGVVVTISNTMLKVFA